MERLVGDGNLTRLVCVLVPNIIEFVKKPDELGSLFKLFSHPDEAVTSMISESLSQMMQTEGQDFILLSFILEQLPVHENSQLFVSKAIRVMGGEGAFYRTRQTSVLLEFLSSDAPYLSNSAQDAVIALAKSDDLAYKQNLVDSKIMSYLEKLNLSDIHRPVGLALSCSVLPSLCALSMSSGQGLEVVNMFFDSYEPLRRIIDAQWQELVKTPQGVSVLVRENVVPLVLQRIGHSVGHFAIPLVCYLSRRCGNSLVLRKQGWLFLDMMDSRDDELTKAGILNLLALSEGSEEHAAMIFDVPRIRERLASALDSLYEPETIVDILHVVQNLVRGSSMRSERCLFSPVSTCVYKHTRSAVRSIRLTSLHILYNIFLSITDKMSMIDEDLVEALHTTLTTSQDNETYAAP
ncbi:uncharacterized protein EI90DRAFT_1737459 [Cantharellus anzutake]|uniref:uncharacterized protein n=1 Tax=Cantharellus anzutake TaxID=1750568 RepID=UPI001904D543|nr:uncharacterized protein EI90DRAFT_1737459 [Cantharellus anzutake]KAF8341435.1 hypothetical protein EI90DRAFT_1737459 [Cantharellus anzutake]